MSETLSLWPVRVRLSDVQRAPQNLDMAADDTRRAAIAEALDLVALEAFDAQVRVIPWLDGLQVDARWSARIVQTCGVSLDEFTTPLDGAFTVRAVPHGSDAAPSPTAELSVDPEEDDPPELLDGDEADVGDWLVEHLALEIDPFPRKPGVVFDPPPEEKPASPFAALKGLRGGGPAQG